MNTTNQALQAMLAAIAANPHGYLIVGDLDKPFHLCECACLDCEQWRINNGRPTREQVRAMVKEA